MQRKENLEEIYTGKEAINMIRNYNRTYLDANPGKRVDTSLIDRFEYYSLYLMMGAVLLFITWKYYKQEKTNKSMSFFILSLAFINSISKLI